MQNSTSNIFTVTQLNYSVRHLLEMELGQVWLIGEISNFSQPVSGHWYLSLKDENAQVPVSYTHLRAHETGAYLVCRLLLEKKKL